MVRSADGVEIHAECSAGAGGGGLPVVFSCAYATTHENWRPQVDPLVEAGHRVVLWDHRGHGRSEAPRRADAYSMDRVLEDLSAVLDWTAPGEQVVLVGLSFGGLASLQFTLRDPARVRGLVLSGSSPGFKNRESVEYWKRRTGRTAHLVETEGLQAFVSGWAAPMCIGRRPELPAARAAAEAVVAQDPIAVAQFSRHVMGPMGSVVDELRDIEHSALILVGEEDTPLLRGSEALAAKLPNARHEVVPRAGHILNIEAADAFNSQLLDFLEELRSGDRCAAGSTKTDSS